MAYQKVKETEPLIETGEIVREIRENVTPMPMQNISPTPESKEHNFETGNYIIEVNDHNGTIRKWLATDAEIKITKLKDGGMLVDIN